jgi:rod shape-determining protein MreD
MSMAWNQTRFVPQHMLPGALLFLTILLSSVDFHLPALKAGFPQLATMTIFYWGIYWPRLMPYWLVLILGLVQDALYGLPLGCIAFSNGLMLAILLSFRRYFVNATFLALWLSYALMALGQHVVIAGWLYFSYGYFLFPHIAVLQWLLSVLVYPIMQCGFFWFHSTLLRFGG